MSAVNKGCVWRYNLFGAKGPLRFKTLFQAGATQAVKSGEILDLSSGNAVPLASDKAMSGIIAVMDAMEIRSGDLAGYHPVIVPRPGDVFEFALSAASAPAVDADLYWSTSQILAVAGTNIIGYVLDPSIVPDQGFQSVNPSYDAGTTIRTTGSVLMVFKQSVSCFAAFCP